MKTYYARNPASWVQILEPTSGLDKCDALLIQANGQLDGLKNVVADYKILVANDESCYDSFVHIRGEWLPYSYNKHLDDKGRAALHMAIRTGALYEDI